MKIFQSPLGDFTLNRYPLQKDQQLHAWEAADEYLLSHLKEKNLLLNTSKILIINDNFGALSIPLASFNTTSISDSYLSHLAILQNAKTNQLTANNIQLNNTLQALDGVYDIILIKVPKNLAMLEDELFLIRPHCNTNTVIIAAAMTRHIHTSTLKLFERIIGPTKTSLAKKKARLIFSELNTSLKVNGTPYPTKYNNDASGENYLNHANIFSRDKLDIGSRFMLQHIPQSPLYQHIVDLACGNGVLGIAAAKQNPQAEITFVDESFMAISSSQYNVDNLLVKNGDNESRFHFSVTDCLKSVKEKTPDLIINNPPFHQQHVVGGFIAQQMFKESYEKLRSRGEFWIVGNRHLGYHVKLKRLFGNCTNIASNKKFIIFKAVKK